jgi:hypothetical protein
MLPIHEMTDRELQEQIQNERANREELMIRMAKVESLIEALTAAKIRRDNN